MFVLVLVARLRSSGLLPRQVRDLPLQLPDNFSPVTTNTSGKVTVVGVSLGIPPPARYTLPGARTGDGSGVLAGIPAGSSGAAPRSDR